MSTLEADVGEGQVSYNSWRRSDLQAMRGSRLPYVTVPCAAVKPCVGAIVLLRVAAIERLCYISQHCQSSNGTGRARRLMCGPTVSHPRAAARRGRIMRSAVRLVCLCVLYSA